MSFIILIPYFIFVFNFLRPTSIIQKIEQQICQTVINSSNRTQVETQIVPAHLYIKVAVDIERAILAGGGELHADCEAVLLEDGSMQENIWGASWNPSTQEIYYESLTNIRPRQNNRSMEILDLAIPEKVTQVTQELLEGI